MKKKQSSSHFTEYNEPSLSQMFTPVFNTSDTSHDQEALTSLMEAGFAWEEAVYLLGLRERLYENSEIRQRMADDCRIQFARWLYENGEMSDN